MNLVPRVDIKGYAMVGPLVGSLPPVGTLGYLSPPADFVEHATKIGAFVVELARDLPE